MNIIIDMGIHIDIDIYMDTNIANCLLPIACWILQFVQYVQHSQHVQYVQIVRYVQYVSMYSMYSMYVCTCVRMYVCITKYIDEYCQFFI